MGEHENAQGGEKNAQKMHRQKPQGKNTASYWLNKVKKPKGCAHFGVQICHGGERHRFPLHTATKETAAGRARERFDFLVGNGWPATLAKFKPEVVAKVKSSTVGGLLRAVEATTTSLKPVTLGVYSQALRQIAAGIAGIGDQPRLDENGEPVKNRRGRIQYHSRRHGAGNEAWLAAVDALPLSVLTPAAVQKWRKARLDAVGTAPDARRRAESTTATVLRNARALFSDDNLEHAKDELVLPEPRPFAGLKLPKKRDTRYKSRIDAGELIKAARSTLTGEVFKVFTLSICYGLRKREIDALKWEQVNFGKRVLQMDPTDVFEAKSEESEHDIDIDDEMISVLRGWRAQTKGEFVIAAKEKARSVSKRGRVPYRCEEHFRTLYAWLRDHGVKSQKPLHELRKEVGAILASTQGIYAAQRVLRHAQISTTADHYADKKGRITAGLGALLAAPVTNVITAEFNAEPMPAKQIKRKGAA